MRCIQDLTEHVQTIAHAFRIELTLHDSVQILFSECDAMHRRIRCPTICTELRYAVVLHELGHLIHPGGFLRTEGNDTLGLRLEEERNAWEWARKFALRWTPAMEDAYEIGMHSYVQSAQKDDELRDMFIAMLAKLSPNTPSQNNETIIHFLRTIK